MSLRWDDLPRNLRDRIPAEARPTRKSPSRAGAGSGGQCRGRCSACGSTYDTYTAYERHGCTAGRWEIDLED